MTLLILLVVYTALIALASSAVRYFPRSTEPRLER
jgi:hypothetical protein